VKPGGLHAVKATTRPAVTTAGAGNPFVSFLEDVVSAIMALVAVLLSAMAVILVQAFGFLIGRWFRRRRSRRSSFP